MPEEPIRDQHESYGTISFSRVQMSETPLFGSSILHSTGIVLEISEADLDRHLSQDWIHPGRPILRAMLSPHQFVDAITRLNQGVGAPITLEYVMGDKSQRRAPPPPPQVHAHFEREIEGSLTEVISRVDELIEASRGSAKRKAEGLKQQLLSNIPFLERQLRRQMSKTVAEAKMEFEAHVSSRLEEMGLEALRERIPSLPEVVVEGEDDDALVEGVSDDSTNL